VTEHGSWPFWSKLFGHVDAMTWNVNAHPHDCLHRVLAGMSIVVGHAVQWCMILGQMVWSQSTFTPAWLGMSDWALGRAAEGGDVPRPGTWVLG
jgi:hypothetical protein